ncbi:MAG: glycosyltransferase [Lachnospiraceae bacterium]|nr:glycosyltransferase [Lachnospiraceae bacterium]
MKKVSIIVPVYNAATYLERSLKSICEQTYQDLEIILIDDGSTDNSLACCQSWKQKDNRIVVYHQANAGVSAARNRGLDIATGEYIMFVDADDWIAPDMVQALYGLAVEHNADVSTCDYLEVPETKEYLAEKQEKEERGCKEDIKIATEKVESGLQLLLPWAVYCKMYRKEILESIRFESYKIAEDLLFNTTIICDTNLQRVVTTDRKMYYYFIHENSAIRQGYQRKYLEGVKAEERCYNRLIAISPKFGDINIVGCSISMLFERMAELTWKERRAVIEDFRWCKKSAKEYKKALLDTTNMHRKISGMLKVYVPDVYLWTLIVRKRLK